MVFKSKPEAITYSIYLLMQLQLFIPNEKILKCVEQLKISFENHEQKILVICDHLNQLLSSLTHAKQKVLIENLIKTLVNSSYTQTPEEKFKNPLARRAESELMAVWVMDPPPAMMAAVKRVSDEILKTFDDLKNHPDKEIFLDKVTRIEPGAAFGSLLEIVTLDRIETILKANCPANLPEILCIHEAFSETLKKLPIRHAPKRQPIGRLEKILKELFPSSTLNFFQEGISADTEEGIKNRSYIHEIKIYKSELYTQPGARGRLLSELNLEKRKDTIGIMREEYSEGLPRLSYAWVADCCAQNPNYASPYVAECLETDVPYLSGPSGLASALLGQMESLANLESLALKQLYLSAVIAYIVGGGYHSIHEVLCPAQFCLDLVPGYPVFVPGRSRSSMELKLPSSPQYHIYFDQLAKIDPDFENRRQRAWQHYLNFFENNYLPKQQHLLEVKITDEKKEGLRHTLFAQSTPPMPSEHSTDTMKFSNHLFHSSATSLKHLNHHVPERSAEQQATLRAS